MRYSLFTLFVAITLFAVGCSKDEEKPSFSSIEGGWFAQRYLTGNYTQERHSIFLNSGGSAKIYYFQASPAIKYRFDGTYTQTGDTITINYEESLRSGTSPNFTWTNRDVTMKLGVNDKKSYAEGRWFALDGAGTQTKGGQIYMNQDPEMSESIIAGPFVNVQ